MLKKRLIPCLVMKDNLIVQSIGFKRYLPVGKATIAVEFMTNWDVDEIFLIDISATTEKRAPQYDIINVVSQHSFVPLTVGGGIHSIDDIRKIIRAGADKISINSEALLNPGFIRESSDVFGAQCIVVSIDVKINNAGNYEVMGDNGSRPTGLAPVDWARQVASLGAGEIFLNSIDRDGSKRGYDVALIKIVTQEVTIPVIACGGVGKKEDLIAGIREGGASAVSAANIFHYTEHSTIIAKALLRKNGIDVRLNTAANYEGFDFDELGRLEKKGEDDLEKLWFEKGKKEVI
jgi:cyclase